MPTTITLLVPLFVAAAILLAGNGIQGTLVTLRGNLEGFTAAEIGLIGTAYFAGFGISCLFTPHLIRRVGYIRVFAALAALAAAGTLGLVLIFDPLLWMAIRFTTGFCFSGLFMVIESWLNASTPNAQRARVLSIYILVDLAAVTSTQFLLPAVGIDGFHIFALVAMFFCMSLVPVSLFDRASPKPPEAFSFDLGRIWTISPLACAGCVTIGLTNSAFRLVGPLYADGMGLDITGIAVFMSAGIIGGAVAQYPLGYLSDRLDRRVIVTVATTGAALAGLLLTYTDPGQPLLIYGGAFLFGAFALPLYSLSMAHANDRARPEDCVLVSAALLFFFSIGATIGPIIASLVIDWFGPPAFFAYTSAIHGLLIVTALIRMARQPGVPAKARASFTMLLRTSPVLVRLASGNGKPHAESGRTRQGSERRET